MAGLLMVIVNLTLCGVILDFVVDRQVFGLILCIHWQDSGRKKAIISNDLHPKCDLMFETFFYDYKVPSTFIRNDRSRRLERVLCRWPRRRPPSPAPMLRDEIGLRQTSRRFPPEIISTGSSRTMRKNSAYDRQRCHSPRVDRPQPQLAGCDVRLCREPAVPASPILSTRSCTACWRAAWNWGILFARDFGAAGALTERPSTNCRFYPISRDARFSAWASSCLCAPRQQSAGRHHPRRHRLLAHFEPRLQSAVGRQRRCLAWACSSPSSPGANTNSLAARWRTNLAELRHDILEQTS